MLDSKQAFPCRIPLPVWALGDFDLLKVILYSYLILKKMNERITDS